MDEIIQELLKPIEYAPAMVEWMRQWQHKVDFACILEGHLWREGTALSDGIICIRCGRKPNE